MASVVIAGAGVFGAALAHRLAGEGWEVTLVERVAAGHPAATSGGGTRLIRAGHGADAFHARSARRAREVWRAIEEETGERLMVECGVAWFGRETGAWERETERVLSAEGIPVERLTPEEAGKLFPAVSLADVDHVLLEPEAGVLRAARATAALARAASERGAKLVTAEAAPAGSAVALGDGRTLEADRVVWACGPWLAGLFPEHVRLRVTRQEVTLFEAGPEWSPPHAPAWIDYDRSFYGLGPLDGAGMKVASDAPGPEFDPDAADRTPGDAAEPHAREYLALRFPALASPRLASVEVCQYELTPDNRFICAPHPEHDRVWFLGGGSGHGFKHGPALAERLSRMLAGEEEPDPGEGLGPRAVERSLRTAGLRATGRARR